MLLQITKILFFLLITNPIIANTIGYPFEVSSIPFSKQSQQGIIFFDDLSFGIVYSSYGNLYCQFFSYNGTRVDDPLNLTHFQEGTTIMEFSIGSLVENEGVIIVYEKKFKNSSKESTIFVQLLFKNGTIGTSSQIKIKDAPANFESYFVYSDLNGRSFNFLYADSARDCVHGIISDFTGESEEKFTLYWDFTRLNFGKIGFLQSKCAWIIPTIVNSCLKVRLYSTGGILLSESVPFYEPKEQNTRYIMEIAVLNDEYFVLIFGNENSELYYQSFYANGTLLGDLKNLPNSLNQHAKVISLNNSGRFMITYTDTKTGSIMADFFDMKSGQNEGSTNLIRNKFSVNKIEIALIPSGLGYLLLYEDAMTGTLKVQEFSFCEQPLFWEGNCLHNYHHNPDNQISPLYRKICPDKFGKFEKGLCHSLYFGKETVFTTTIIILIIKSALCTEKYAQINLENSRKGSATASILGRKLSSQLPS
jgi:hypothetical protein